MSNYMLLGPGLLQDFEVPSHILWGGGQRLFVHQMPGGARVIDSLGRNDAPITWRGIFSGSDAILRARAIDLMRSGGGVWPLAWSSFVYSVVISEFIVDYTRNDWLPYVITCSVLRDEAEGLVEDALDMASAISGDVASAASLTDAVALDGVSTSLAQTGAFNPGAGSYLASATGLAAALSSTNGQLSASCSTITTPSSVAGLISTTDAAGQAAGLSSARGYLSRAQNNLATLQN